ncbi:hypothetical protein JNL27_13905 [bacterium]|nr:hypothetical protein [bacterium]
MNSNQGSRFFILGGISGIVGTLCYVIAIAIPMSHVGTYIFAMSWPILSIVFVFSLFRYIALDSQSAANQLAFVFSCLAFVIVAVMMSSQLAVKAGVLEYIESSTASEQELLKLMRRVIRLVDMGMDVAWDLFIGASLIFLSIALKGHRDFGLRWTIPAALLGLVLMILNFATFPWPPDTKGLIDVGPAVGLYIIGLSVRLVFLGKRMGRVPLNAAPEK